jgi:hypothetical protein
LPTSFLKTSSQLRPQSIQPYLPIPPPQHLEQFGHLLPLLLGVAGHDGMLDAMADVVFEHLFLDALQSCTYRSHLGYDIDAVAVLLEHSREAAHLTLDPGEPLQAL